MFPAVSKNSKSKLGMYFAQPPFCIFELCVMLKLAFFANGERLVLRLDLIATDVTVMRGTVLICSLNTNDLEKRERKKEIYRIVDNRS